MNGNSRNYFIFAGLYFASFLVFAGWFVLLFVGFIDDDVMRFANKIALPTLIGSAICMEVFRRLTRKAEQKVRANG